MLLIEAGGSDEAEAVLDPALWPTNLGSERDWGFQAEPNPHLDGRALSMAMGKGLGGGSSVNVMAWARGHRSDWDHFAAVSGDLGWGYDAVLDIFRRIENWQARPIRSIGAPQGRSGSRQRVIRARWQARCSTRPKRSASHALIIPMAR
ncbi:GMC family oxidoreductase N-terminal domain-containing protein [Novosphingobium gossypii]|uniref:GMC family oxidoreductase N-terminal domain-containing protein n=1 Tax=Novosphingobium gossypii TaxID=1604774 RepID=UPI003D21FA69